MEYDSFSMDYDRFVAWPGRLAFEMPFLEAQIEAAAVEEPLRDVLDAACGTGMHAIELARRGYRAAGADLSPGMIARARENAARAGEAVRFAVAGFGALAETFREGDLFPFDALLCLGNSLPHAGGLPDLQAALDDFAACLQPGGRLLIQNRNFEAVLAGGERWMPPQSHREGGREWLFIRFYDFDPDGRITFNILSLDREGTGEWRQQVTTTRLLPLLLDDLEPALEKAGFRDARTYGGLNGAPFDPRTSPNLVISALRG